MKTNKEKKIMPNYWVVGATWNNSTECKDEDFVEKGIWMLGWGEGFQVERARQMQSGDRIAIKRMKGQGQTEITIMHIGIIKGVILESNKVICTVDWVAKNLNRDVESRGCFQSVHGPVKKDEWTKKIFHI